MRLQREPVHESFPESAIQQNAFAISADVALRQLAVDVTHGLDQDRVERVRQQFGWNELAVARPEPDWKKFLAQFRGLVIWILIVAAVIAGTMGEWVDTIAILAIVLVNGVFGFLQEQKAGRALAALRAMSSPMATVRRNGAEKRILAREIVVGDVVLLEAGDKIPADARLLESFNATVHEASLTGESIPVAKDAATVLPTGTPIADRRNMVFRGTEISTGKATTLVTATGMQTELGRIAGMLRLSETELTPLQRRLDELGRILVVVCLVLVGSIFLIQYARGGELMETLLVSVSLAVAAVPEGLPAVVTIALALGLNRMVKRNVLIRSLPSVETLGSVTVICSDKTGTLTRNEMTVREICVGDGCYRVSGAGYEAHGEIVRCDSGQSCEQSLPDTDAPDHEPNHESATDLNQALTIAVYCNSASIRLDTDGHTWEVVGDPTEGALLVAAMKAGIDKGESQRSIVFEIPFDSDRKAMSVVSKAAGASGHHSKPEPDIVSGNPGDQRLLMHTKGAPEVILKLCSHELRGGKVLDLTDQRKHEIESQNSDMANRALRVLAFAYRENPKQVADQFLESELIYAGSVGMLDPPREEAKTAVAECHAAGIRPVMITGDHPETALAIGRELKIVAVDSKAITGRQLDAMSDAELCERVEHISVYARVSAADKLRVVRAWKQRGQVVAMTGDGVNDAPAVKAADTGIAMGITGTDVTKEAADMILTDDNFASIVNAIREGRGIFDNIQKFVHYLLSCNAGEVMLMFAAALIGLPLPLIAIQILWVNLVTDGLPALALAMEPPERDIMQRRPRPPAEPVITWQRGSLICYHGSLIAAAALAGFWWIYTSEPANLGAARTATFAIVSFSQLAFALVCRSQTDTLPQLGLFSNPWLFAAIALSGLLQLGVLTVPIAQSVFGTVSLPATTWALVFCLSLLPATVIELAKIAYTEVIAESVLFES